LYFAPPLFGAKSCTSKPDAYRTVERYREWRAEDRTRVRRIDVMVSEDGGTTWQVYERIVL
jgi:hypothetical protein